MKKLILSAVFALACFTAQAKNEVVSNDDKNPKSKTKVVANSKEERPLLVACIGRFSVSCSDGSSYSGTVSWQSNDCAGSGGAALASVGAALCN